MKSMKKMAMGLACGVILAGCSHGVQIAEHADHYNNSVEQVENRMLMKNVIRASKRMPLHFTRISDITGKLSSSIGTGEATIPSIGVDGGVISYTATPSLAASSSPEYSLQVLASDKFFKGIMTPVNISTLKFFVDQGWPVPILMFLFVEGIDVSFDEDTPLCSIDNDPLDDTRWAEFELAVRVVESLGTFKSQPSNSNFGPLYKPKNISAEELTLLEESDLKLKRIEKGEPLDKDDQKSPIAAFTGFQAFEADSSEAIEIDRSKIDRTQLSTLKQKLNRASIEFCPATIIALMTENPERFDQYTTKLTGDMFAGLTAEEFTTDVKSKQTKLHAKIRLRPALNMIYYLGELARYQRVEKMPRTSVLLDAGCALSDSNGTCAKRERPSTRVREITNPMALVTVLESASFDSTISFEVGNKTYSVPPYPAVGRTTQFLTLVRQILQLNISSDDFPTSQTVQLVTSQ